MCCMSGTQIDSEPNWCNDNMGWESLESLAIDRFRFRGQRFDSNAKCKENYIYASEFATQFANHFLPF